MAMHRSATKLKHAPSTSRFIHVFRFECAGATPYFVVEFQCPGLGTSLLIMVQGSLPCQRPPKRWMLLSRQNCLMPKSESKASLSLQTAHCLVLAHLQRSGHSTANARALGSVQGDALRRHGHSVYFRANGDASSGSTHDVLKTGTAGNYSGPTTVDGGAETRPSNTALHPRIQI